ncbi:hypothetical protein CAPTEDRAFT_197993 [Capitella teleta]|uniref:Reverse transcriptase domain-containing protein n=1 Tax=Capitella teleta TaxID=283909 RepID=R7T728_CAPTE|nr:hypothetical protein CAPTEDRAFT_197993 [Capitella teleta]|eukprot:ELT89375.1 hypothetical protein CAPTEDRAFT_197993 [Capitella teleta]
MPELTVADINTMRVADLKKILTDLVTKGTARTPPCDMKAMLKDIMIELKEAKEERASLKAEIDGLKNINVELLAAINARPPPMAMSADDTTLYCSGPKIKHLMANMNSDLQNTFNYFAANSLQANVSKTNYMIIHPNRNTAGHTPLHINNTNISQVKESTFLGITIDQKLTFQPHIKKITNKISSGLFALHQVKNVLPRSHLKPIYHALIESHLNYSITFWNTATQTHTQRLKVLQKKALHITHSDDNAPSAPLFASEKNPHIRQST